MTILPEKWFTKYMAGYLGKRPLWQWFLIYAVVGGIVYFLIYYFVLAPKGGYKVPGTSGTTQTTPGY